MSNKKNEAPKVEATKENKDFTNSKLVTDLLAKCKELGQKAPENKAVGNNGYQPGQMFKVAGVEIVETAIGTSKICYPAFVSDNGERISVKGVMGLSSLQSFEISGSFVVESDVKGQKVEKNVTAQVVEDFDFSQSFHTNKGLLDFLAEIEEQNGWQGKTLVYLGQVVRPIVARDKSPVTSFEAYKAGYKRAITARLWHVE